MRPVEQIGTRRLDSSDRGAGERMPADEAQALGKCALAASTVVPFVLPTSVTIASPAMVPRQLAQHVEVLPDGRGEDDQLRRPPAIASSLAPNGDRLRGARLREHLRAVDADHLAARPAPADRQRQGAADQAAANDRDAREDGRYRRTSSAKERSGADGGWSRWRRARPG